MEKDMACTYAKLARLMTILLLGLPAAAQTVYSGQARYLNTNSAASALPTFVGYTGQDIVQWPATVPSAGGATRPGSLIYDTSYPGGTPARIARCTDRSSIPGQPNTQTVAGLGGSGVGVLFNTTDTVLHVTTGTGGDAMILFDPVNMVCAATAITKDKNQTNPGSSSSYADFGGGFFSPADPTIWYSFGGRVPWHSGSAVHVYLSRHGNLHSGADHGGLSVWRPFDAQHTRVG
jgi:hypothetical protein